MSDQMALLPHAAAAPEAPTPAAPADASWDIDDRTREMGRRGLAAARRALRQASAGLAA